MVVADFEVSQELHARLARRYRTIDGWALQKLCLAGEQWLRTNQQLVNTLNVFPVPDGDTGTNMVLTMKSAADEIRSSGERSIGKVAHAIAHGALMGARGNSGVILSQLWRGFARTVDERPILDAVTLVQALAEARDTAYKGVVRPVEGTILTVSKDMAAGASEALKNGASSVLEILEQVVRSADASVKRTPDLLPILKEAGVVDAGGKGLFFILEGMLRAAYGQTLDQPLATVQPLSSLAIESAAEIVEEGQDWEVVVDFRPRSPLDLQAFYKVLDQMGTSIQLGEGDGIHRMHIHTPDNDQYEPIEYIRSLGTVARVIIENLMAQMEARAPAAQGNLPALAAVKPGQIAAVVVAPGLGIARVFASLGAAAIVEGGQTMNPSTQEFLTAIENLPTDKIIILPNNKNILLAAQQASELTVKQVTVVPSVSIPQGIAAMFTLELDGDYDTIVNAMTASLEEPKSAELCYATRSAEIDGVAIHQGQVIGMLDGRLVASGDSLEQTLMTVLEEAQADRAELITLYYGADLSAMQANQIGDKLRERWSTQEVEVLEGGQPHYQLILAIE